MMRAILTGIAVATASAVPAASVRAQTATVAEAPETERLAAAKALLRVVMPGDMQQNMMTQLAESMKGMTTNALKSAPGMAEMAAKHPAVLPIMERYVAQRQEASFNLVRDNFPMMLAAMERAYARRFTVVQMQDAERFFTTATGQAYLRNSVTIMSDPDVRIWLQTLMEKAMASAPDGRDQLISELKAATGE